MSLKSPRNRRSYRGRSVNQLCDHIAINYQNQRFSRNPPKKVVRVDGPRHFSHISRPYRIRVFVRQKNRRFCRDLISELLGLLHRDKKTQKLSIICDFSRFFLICSLAIPIYVSFWQKSLVYHRYNRRFLEKSQLIFQSPAISTTWARN